jgi:hypothetical protein
MVTVDVHQNIEVFIVKYLYEHLVVIQILGKHSKLKKWIFSFCYYSKNGGTCVTLENNQGKFKRFIWWLFSKIFLAQCLCSPVFRGITCNQFSYVPCGDATCHGTQVKKQKRLLGEIYLLI